MKQAYLKYISCKNSHTNTEMEERHGLLYEKIKKISSGMLIFYYHNRCRGRAILLSARHA